MPNALKDPRRCALTVCAGLCVYLCGRGNLQQGRKGPCESGSPSEIVTGHEANFVQTRCLCLDHAINEAGLFCHVGCVCELPGGRPFRSCWASVLCCCKGLPPPHGKCGDLECKDQEEG